MASVSVRRHAEVTNPTAGRVDVPELRDPDEVSDEGSHQGRESLRPGPAATFASPADGAGRLPGDAGGPPRIPASYFCVREPQW